MPINLSRAVVDAIKVISKLSEVAFEAFVNALGHCVVSLSMEEVVESLEIQLSEMSIGDVWKLLQLITALDAVRINNRLKEKTLVEEFHQELSRLVSAGTLGKVESDIALHRIERLLEIEGPVRLVTKAMTVITDHAKVFRTARILTDLRPIFAENGESDGLHLGAATVVHQLKIDYQGRHGTDEFFVALDESDLKLLESLIQRAHAKGKLLEELLASASIPYVTTAQEGRIE